MSTVSCNYYFQAIEGTDNWTKKPSQKAFNGILHNVFIARQDYLKSAWMASAKLVADVAHLIFNGVFSLITLGQVDQFTIRTWNAVEDILPQVAILAKSLIGFVCPWFAIKMDGSSVEAEKLDQTHRREIREKVSAELQTQRQVVRQKTEEIEKLSSELTSFAPYKELINAIKEQCSNKNLLEKAKEALKQSKEKNACLQNSLLLERKALNELLEIDKAKSQENQDRVNAHKAANEAANNHRLALDNLRQEKDLFEIDQLKLSSCEKKPFAKEEELIKMECALKEAEAIVECRHKEYHVGIQDLKEIAAKIVLKTEQIKDLEEQICQGKKIIECNQEALDAALLAFDRSVEKVESLRHC